MLPTSVPTYTSVQQSRRTHLQQGCCTLDFFVVHVYKVVKVVVNLSVQQSCEVYHDWG